MHAHSHDPARVFNITPTPISPPWRKKDGGKAVPTFRGELADGTPVYRYRSGGVLTHAKRLGLETHSTSLVEAWFTVEDYVKFQKFVAFRNVGVDTPALSPVVVPDVSVAAEPEIQVESAPDYTDAELDALAEDVKDRLKAREQYRASCALLEQLKTDDTILVDSAATVAERLRQAAYRR